MTVDTYHNCDSGSISSDLSVRHRGAFWLRLPARACRPLAVGLRLPARSSRPLAAELPFAAREHHSVAARLRRLLAAILTLPLLATMPAGPGAAGKLPAQVVERERQTEFVPTLGMVEVDASLRNRLDLFPDVQGFRAARLFLRSDGTVVLEIESRLDGRLERERRVLTEAELETLRADIREQVAEGDVRPTDDRGGRGGLVLSQTLLGLAYHGWAVPLVLDVSSARVGVAAYLLTAGASFYLPYRLTRDRAVSEAHRDLAFFGNTRGIGAGLLLADIFADDDPTGASDSGTRTRLASGMALGLGGGLLGFAAAERFRPTPGTAALWTTMGDLGFAAGALGAYVAGPYASDTVQQRQGDVVWTEDRTRNPSVGHVMTVAGGLGGLAAGGWIGGRTSMTEGNVAVLRSAAILGAQTGLTLARAASSEGRAIAAGALVGGLTATATSVRPLRDRRFSQGEGLLVAAGHIAGGATALGLTYLVLDDIDDHPVAYLTTSTLGSVLGAGLVFRALDPGSEPMAFGGGASGSGAGQRGGAGTAERTASGRLSIELHPTALLAPVLEPSSIPPLLTIRF